MKSETRHARHRQITEAAYLLLAEHGYQATSMLRIAKAANASNQTMYRWYGDKRGLFKRMVEDNAEVIRQGLSVLENSSDGPLSALERLGPILIGVLLSERPVLLNRAAAADGSGELGRVISEAGREQVVPSIIRLIRRAAEEKRLAFPDPAAAAELYVDLMLGDLQIRRVTGAIGALTEAQIQARAGTAFACFLKLGAQGGTSAIDEDVL